MRAMATATRLTTKGQVVIPKAVRERLRWAPGTKLAVEEVGTGALRLSPLETADPIDRLYGCLRAAPRDPLVELEAEHRAEIEVDEHRQRRGR
jgi:AbrB family looped-hinge helix DNA binding protein